MSLLLSQQALVVQTFLCWSSAFNMPTYMISADVVYCVLATVSDDGTTLTLIGVFLAREIACKPGQVEYSNSALRLHSR